MRFCNTAGLPTGALEIFVEDPCVPEWQLIARCDSSISPKRQYLVSPHAHAFVNLVGPRQAGKTTLIRDLLAEGKFITLDDDGRVCR